MNGAIAEVCAKANRTPKNSKMTTIGSGELSIFQDGSRTDGTWKKSSRLERTRFYDSQGAEIPLNRGQIWVEILPQDGTITLG